MAVAGPFTGSFVLLYELFLRGHAFGQLQSSFLLLIVHFARSVLRQEKCLIPIVRRSLFKMRRHHVLDVLRILRSFLKMYEVYMYLCNYL